MLKIGITGGIGSGKSTVCKIFSLLQVPIFDADTAAKLLYDEDIIFKQKILNLFGEEVYENGLFNRKKMAAIVFNSPEKLTQLNALIHPLVEQKFQAWAAIQNAPYIIKEAALLIESKSFQLLDKIILVTCPLSTRISRVMQRDQISEAQVMARMKHQLSDEEKRPFIHYIITNDGKQLLIPQVLNLHQELLAFQIG